MAFNLCNRFPSLPYHYRLLDPGSYQIENSNKTKTNKAPFLSNTERNTYTGARIWTDTIYDADIVPKIPNCTSLRSKCPRFPYEALSKEDIEAILCRCGLQNVCECRDENEEEAEVECHAKIHRRLFKGPPPRSTMSGGLSAPSKRDYGFELVPDGTHKRIFVMEKEVTPPFYDARVNEFTRFYHGWKWSQWKGTRSVKPPEQWPGPADYTIERQPTLDEICAENVRAKKRKHSKQLRYIEMVQRREMLEGRPGPATYSPQYPKGTHLEIYGSKAGRFNDKNHLSVGPADYLIRRDFDPPKPPIVACHASLPKPACFGVKALRFKPRQEEGPSPASYKPKIKLCQFMHCSSTPFGSSAQRFKPTPKLEISQSEIEIEPDDDKALNKTCPKPTWMFRSKTIRMKPLKKKPFEQSPADFLMKNISVKRPENLQILCPFCSSEGRFQPWYDWMPFLGRVKTPGAGYYNPRKHTCLPAVHCGPLSKCQRFPRGDRYPTPPPNAYNVDRGIETILATHNERLKKNIKNKHKFHWKRPFEPDMLTMEQRQAMLLNKTIALLDVETGSSKTETTHIEVDDIKIKPKLLNCFLYNHQIRQY